MEIYWMEKCLIGYGEAIDLKGKKGSNYFGAIIPGPL